MINKNLKNIRQNKKIQVEDVCKELHISTSHYYKIEAGTRKPSLSLAIKISDYYNTDISKLF